METNFNNLLVAYDGSASSDKALEMALVVAKSFSSRLSVVTVLTDHAPKEAAVRESVERQVKDAGLPVNFIFKKGRVHKEILHAATETDADLIILGSHGKSGLQEFWVGSNAFRVASSSKAPVISVQENTHPRGFEIIVLPLDDSQETRQKIPFAASLAKYFGSTVHIMAVTHETGNEVAHRVKAYAYQAQKFLEDRGVKTNYTFSQGKNVAKSIIEYSKSIDADLIMMMTETESAGLFTMGTYPQQLINNSPVPVMSIQPKDLNVSYAAL